MTLKLISSLAPGYNQLPREARNNLWLLSSLLYISSTFLRIFAKPNNAHLWISSTGMPKSMALRLSFNISGADPKGLVKLTSSPKVKTWVC